MSCLGCGSQRPRDDEKEGIDTRSGTDGKDDEGSSVGLWQQMGQKNRILAQERVHAFTRGVAGLGGFILNKLVMLVQAGAVGAAWCLGVCVSV